MKRWLCIATLSLLAFVAACNRPVETQNYVSPPPADPALQAIDSLMWQCPDSALACLLPWFDTSCRDGVHTVSENSGDSAADVARYVSTTYDRHYAHLLLAELFYKNDYAQTNRAELRQAVAYLDSLTSTLNDTPTLRSRHCGFDPQSPNPCAPLFFLAARAHYINGVGYYEHDSLVEACKEYLKTLEVMEEHFEEKKIVTKKAKFMALTYSHLTSLFSDLYLHEQAIYFGKMSLKYFQKHKAVSWHIPWMLNNIGSHYDIMNKNDSAYYYYNQGLNCISDTNGLTYRGIASHIAFLNYKMGASPEASLFRLNALLAQAENHQEYASRCLTIGEIYYHQQEFDSAWHYLNIVYEQIQSIGSKKQAAEWLSEIAEAQGKKNEAMEYASFLVPFANVEENQSAIKSTLLELYNTFTQTKLYQQQRNETKKYISRSIITIAGLSIFVILALLILYYRNKRQKQDLETLIETERKAHQIQQAALAGRLKRSNAALDERSKTKIGHADSSYSRHPIGADNYADEPICQQVLAACNDKKKPIKSTIPVSAYSNIALNDIQIAQLKDAAIRHYGQLFDTLKHQYPELKEKDFIYCYMCLLGLDNVQIAVLLQKSVSTIWDRENRLKKIFRTDDKVSVILYRLMIN